MNRSILSTKLLSQPQQELVLNSGNGLVHYNILKINTIFNPIDIKDRHIIVTSKNAVPSLLLHEGSFEKVSCVGSVTSSILIENGIEPVIVGNNAKDLALELTTHYHNDHFIYLCSKQRREELPAVFQDKKIPLKEHIVYESSVVMKSFDRIFAAVLFYSPYGVHAFAKANPKKTTFKAICIGETTATTAREYYENVIVANKQTIENTLITAIKALRND